MDLTDSMVLALNLMNKHGLLAKGWKFDFSRSKRNFGLCNYRKKTLYLSPILVSLNSEKRVQNTILHEIAHALTPWHDHDIIWKIKCLEIGGDGKRCYSEVNTTCNDNARYRFRCPTCGKITLRFKRTRRVYFCGKKDCRTKVIFEANPDYVGV